MSKSRKKFRISALASVILFSALCYVCILHINNPSCLNSGQYEQEELNEVVLPEAEMMRTVVDRAKDLFTVVTHANF